MSSQRNVVLHRPVAELFHFPPSPEPISLAPPPPGSSIAPPFPISKETYDFWLQPSVPATIGLVYATTVLLVNRINKSRNYKPWAFSQTSLFHYLVILHNVFLAVYSGWTCVGMLKTMSTVIPPLNGPDGVAGVVDSLCKMHGPPGLGNAAIFTPSDNKWTAFYNASSVAPHGLPKSDDSGRMWNEGLAFYGWLFYLSKFYEVLDTVVILSKGKRSSTLQTYHHTGAMLCMWAGIRYMSPPIWLFVAFNSAIHTLMVRLILLSFNT
jgi:hypothetical protein